MYSTKSVLSAPQNPSSSWPLLLPFPSSQRQILSLLLKPDLFCLFLNFIQLESQDVFFCVCFLFQHDMRFIRCHGGSWASTYRGRYLFPLQCWQPLGLLSVLGNHESCAHEHSCWYLLVHMFIHFCWVDTTQSGITESEDLYIYNLSRAHRFFTVNWIIFFYYFLKVCPTSSWGMCQTISTSIKHSSFRKAKLFCHKHI